MDCVQQLCEQLRACLKSEHRRTVIPRFQNKALGHYLMLNEAEEMGTLSNAEIKRWHRINRHENLKDLFIDLL